MHTYDLLRSASRKTVDDTIIYNIYYFVSRVLVTEI